MSAVESDRLELAAIVAELERRETLRQGLPRDWNPRPYQKNLWEYMISGGKRAVEIAHRRWGKDELALHWANRALHERPGNYWHMLPEAAQARKAIWEAVNPHTGRRRVDEAFPTDLRSATRDSDMIVKFTCGSTWQVVGSDNFDSLVGSPPIGLVFSEWALADPRAWSILRPILDENGGWAIFITTPRGDNHALRSLKLAQTSPDWFAEVSSAKDTGVFNEEALERIQREYRSELGTDDGDAMFQQEYLCSFDAPLVGAYYATQLRELENAGRFKSNLPVEPGVPVQTAWDLGHSDDTAIWWFQIIGEEIRILNYFAEHGQDVPFYCNVIKDYGKRYGYDYGSQLGARHWVPWDAKPQTLASPRSIVQQAWEQGIKMRVTPKLSVADGIQAARQTLKYCWFDEPNCEQGLRCLRYYQRQWDDDKKVFKRVPLHNWASHGADAFRYLAVAWKEIQPPDVIETDTRPIHQRSAYEGVTLEKLYEDRRKNDLSQQMELI